jgi:predicted amino acid dehydrogenase
MTTRALELTHDPDGRFGPRASSSRVQFVESCRASALRELLADLTQPLLRLRERRGAWDIESIDWTCVAAFFMEPIQGEGGIHPIARETAQEWQEVCAARNVPLIADEIQSGMGRTGTFLYTEQLGVQPDYVLLGKSLGGGLSKISAIAIRRGEYRDIFSLQHGSTFAEDDLSSRVALCALELLDTENALAAAADKGKRLHRALTALAERHSTVVREVRGSGLMLGLEWQPLEFNRSHALRFLQHYGWLGYALAGYLLKAHGVRVAPAISQGNTMRMEPAYSVPEEAIAGLLDGLEELCTLLEREDAAGILAPCIGAAPPAARGQPSPSLIRRSPSTTSHVGFIGHFIDPDGVALWDPSFSRLDASACRSFLDQIRPFAEPLLCHRDRVRSVTGEATTLSFIGIPVTSQQCYDALRTSERKEFRDLIQRAVDLASREGCSVIGLGGYCSILTRNGKDLRPNGIALTTGSGYTVGAGLMAMQQAARSHGISWGRTRAAVIGATGNIGSVLASLLAQSVSSIVLLGRPASVEELRAVAGKILSTIGRDAPSSPIGQTLRARGIGGFDVTSSAESAAAFCRVKCELGDELPIDVGTDLSSCRDAQLIGAASNHPESILLPQHLGEQPTIVIDLAVPGDVHGSVIRERPNARVIRGGVIRTPCDPDWSVPGIPLERGEMFACMTETVLMGLERVESHGSFGSLSTDRVLQTLAMAHKHGFTDIRTRTESA